MKKALLGITTTLLTMMASTQAATVVISNGLAGTSVQGITLEIGTDHTQLLNSADYYVGVGRFVAGQFTPWTTMALDTATGSPAREISGSFTTTAPSASAFDGLQIHVFVGVLSSAGSLTSAFTPSGTQWAVFSPTASILFPVASTSSSQSVALSVPANLSVVATGAPGNAFNGVANTTSGSYTNYYSFAVPVPETSTSLLGAIGALALLRRRRN
jgi:hypothetical protein